MNRRFWSKKDLYRLRQMYPNRYAADIAEKLNRPVSSVYQAAAKLGLKKSEAFHQMEMHKQGERLKRDGTAHRFARGTTPTNKGRKQADFMSAAAIDRTRATRFKKGNVPPNTKATGDGTITIRKDKNGTPYKHIRVALGKWVAYQRVVWQQHNGPIPKGMLVVFKDFDTLNCEPDNLMLLTRADNMKRNSIHNYPEEIKKTMQYIGALNRQINKRQPHGKH